MADATEVFDDNLFRKIVESKGKLVSFRAREIDNKSGRLSNLCKHNVYPVGHFLYDVTYTTPHGNEKTMLIVLKAKAAGRVTVDAINGLAQKCGNPVSTVFEKYKNQLGYCFTDMRELEVYKITDQRFTRITPEVYYINSNPEKEMFIIAMEYLGTPCVTLMNRMDDAPDVWTKKYIEIALRDIAGFHSIHLDGVDSLLKKPYIEAFTRKKMVELTDLWQALADNARLKAPDVVTEKRYKIWKHIIHIIDHIWKELESSPRTLIHNDFNARNACIRLSIQSTAPRPEYVERPDYACDHLCLYDWECSTVHVPQSDIAEFLAFTLAEDTEPSVGEQWLEFYRVELQRHSGNDFNCESCGVGDDDSCGDGGDGCDGDDKGDDSGGDNSDGVGR
ncbi:predicted protein [Nematostella vectensis]|uniref:Aminoglycoside phosphotransferase domain-containing protein n=1 Tax=Nematostella vectensis TaxID=45351 RepID=A7S596_NEMVE|nr:predicted protein [Nematostella vectensis]|eukprot:XP_001633111.1 predicted protein [Nematostella vectensis]